MRLVGGTGSRFVVVEAERNYSDLRCEPLGASGWKREECCGKVEDR